MNIILGLKNKKNKNYNYLITETVNSAGNLHLSLINNVFSDSVLYFHSIRGIHLYSDSYCNQPSNRE